MVRLVAQFHSDLLTETHLLLAQVRGGSPCNYSLINSIPPQELEAEGELRQAEKHFVQSGDWKAAVTMYRDKGHWEDAHKVSHREREGFSWCVLCVCCCVCV